MSKYKNPFSVDYRNTVFIDANDPRAQGWKLGQTKSRVGREVEVVGQNSKPLTLSKYVAPPPAITAWMNLYANYDNEGTAFAYDSQNNLYLLSIDYNYPDYQMMYFIEKLDGNGNFVWETKIDYTHEEYYGFFYVTGITTDSVGNVYVSAALSKSLANQTDVLINIKIDTNGNIIWNKPISNSNYYMGEPNNGGLYKNTFCKVDSDLNVYVVANIEKRTVYYFPGYTSHQLITKLDPSGNIIWQNIYQDTSYGSDNGFYQCYGIDIDSSNNLYTISNGSKGVLTKYDTSGNIVFIKQINHSSLTYTKMADIKIYQNSIYLSIISSNSYQSDNFDNNVFLLKLDTSGNMIWETNIGTIYFSNSYYSPLISLVDNGCIFINMPKYGGGSNTFFYIVKISTDGVFIEQKQVTRPLNITPLEGGSPTHQTILLDINQKDNYLYCSGVIKMDGTSTAFMFKIPSSLSDQYSINFQNAVVRDEKNPEGPYSILKSFNINIENTSFYSPLSSSYLTLSNYTNYSSVLAPFISEIWPIIINKTTTPELIKSSGIFA